MSRNLATSSCCGNTVRLSDLRGKPIEFRRYGPYVPDIGTRWDCPTCNTAYFVIWRTRDKFWHKPEDAFADLDLFGNPNREKGKFVHQYTFQNEIVTEDTGCFTLDLSYYESHNDEPGTLGAEGKPRHLCEDNAEDVEWEW